jgi:hypothetical protein
MSHERINPKRRPGPIAFRSEAKVTTLKSPDTDNAGGIGEARELRIETTTGTKELRVSGPLYWFFIGLICMTAGGLLLEPVLVSIGVLLLIVAVAVRRRNRTETRVRNKFVKSGD